MASMINELFRLLARYLSNVLTHEALGMASDQFDLGGKWPAQVDTIIKSCLTMPRSWPDWLS